MSAVEQLPMQAEAVELVAAIKTPAVLTGNFDQVRAHFVEQLQRYDLVVTVDTLADAKKLATELNKAATEVKARGKAVATEAAAPINTFNEKVKELAQLLLDARTKLTEQIKRFEDETRAKAQEVLQGYLHEQWQAKGVKPEFQFAKVDDLANLSTLTGTGKLSAKAKGAVDERIQADLNLQTQTEMRLLKLENESYRAGLKVALERRHVETFLFAPEDQYQTRLAQLLQAEVEREAKARAAHEAETKAAAERAQQAEAEKQAALREVAELKAAQEQQAQSAERAPQPVVAPISMGGDVVQRAIGALDNPRKAAMHVTTFSEACRIAADTAGSERMAIWTKASGIYPEAIILTGQAIKDYLGA